MMMPFIFGENVSASRESRQGYRPRKGRFEDIESVGGNVIKGGLFLSLVFFSMIA
jgi:hypothetical protein